jgi:hypothetical protein
LPRSPAVARSLKGAAIAALLPALTSGCGGSARHRPAPASRPPLISIFEAPNQITSAPVAVLDELRALGVDYLRVLVPWAAIAPDPAASRPPPHFDAVSPSAYPPGGWRTYDTIVTAAAARGIGIDLDPTGPAPRWATSAGGPKGPAGIWKPSAAELGSFVRALGVRYSGRYTPPGAPRALPRISFWSIWNEPNYGIDLAPQASPPRSSAIEVSPRLYRGLLGAGWAALRQSGHGRDTILIGEVAPRGITGPGYPDDFAGMVPLRFLRALYCVGAALQPLSGTAAALRGCPARPTVASRRLFAARNPALFDASGFSVHPYSQGALPPDLETPGEPDYADLASLPRVERILDTLQATYGSDRRLPIYSTEYGYKTNPPYVAGAPLTLAAAYINWAEYLSWRDPRIRSFDQYLLRDPPVSSGSHFDTGLEFANGTPKPTLAAYRMPVYLPVTGAHAGQALEVWGCVRPVRYTAAGTAQIQFRARAGGGFRTLAAVAVHPADCYFDDRVRFPSGGTVRVAWSYPGGATIYSRQVQVTVS